MRCLLLVAVTLAIATTAEAQYGTGQGVRQAGYGVRGSAPAYRVASRPTVGTVAGSQAAKPFTGLTHGPTVSPYLNLFREESESAAPNYYAFVLPMQQQQQAAQDQQRQLQQLQRQVQQATYQRPTTASVPGGARFGDTGRYYSGWRR